MFLDFLEFVVKFIAFAVVIFFIIMGVAFLFAFPLIETSEKAYMEGQIDYAKGDIRIEKIEGDYRWTESPWDDTEWEPEHRYYSEY